MGGLTSYFARRLLLLIPTFIGITILVFTIMQFVPGGPLEQELLKLRAGGAMGGSGGIEGGKGGSGGFEPIEIPQDALDEMKKFYGLDKPIPIRYLNWFWNILHLDLGKSYVYSEPVWDVIKARFPVSIYFGLFGLILSYSVCIPLGVMKAVKHGSKFDLGSSILVFVGYSTPGWALGAVLVVLLGGGSFWDVFPLGDFRAENWEGVAEGIRNLYSNEAQLKYVGKLWNDLPFVVRALDQIHHTVLPLFAWTVAQFAILTMLMKNSLMENLGQDYVRTAFAKGLHEKRVIFVHALRNSLIPIATGLGHVIGIILAGSYLIEKMFNINGFGLLGFNSLVKRDYPIVLGTVVIGSLLRLTGNILSDVFYALVDPRIRFK
ncbi:ABC transporter permease subunit [bacterium]|nr:ABC transporter permease subunit [bacterium]